VLSSLVVTESKELHVNAATACRLGTYPSGIGFVRQAAHSRLRHSSQVSSQSFCREESGGTSSMVLFLTFHLFKVELMY
jgi:hypothetical protein